MKKIGILVFIVLVIIFSVVIAFLVTPEGKSNTPISQDKIMYFYSDTCHYCIQQKPILEELEKEGVQFERMNVGEHPEYYKEYDVSGTPTFIFKEKNKKLTGLQTKETLLKFWNDNK